MLQGWAKAKLKILTIELILTKMCITISAQSSGLSMYHRNQNVIPSNYG